MYQILSQFDLNTKKPDHRERLYVKNGHSSPRRDTDYKRIQWTRTYTSDLLKVGTVDCCALGTVNYDVILVEKRGQLFH